MLEPRILTLSSTERAELQQAFNIFDEDGTGVITIAELVVALQALGEDTTQAELRHILPTHIIEETDAIDFNEFAAIITDRMNCKCTKSNIERMFINIANSQEHLTFDRFKEVAKEIGDPISEAELSQIFSAA